MEGGEEAQKRTLRDYVTLVAYSPANNFELKASAYLYGPAILVWRLTNGGSQFAPLGLFKGVEHFEDQRVLH